MEKVLSVIKNFTWRQWALLAVGLVLAIGAFAVVRFLVVTTSVIQLPGITLTEEPAPDGTAAPSSDNSVAPLEELPPAWDGASRVTVLLIGLDYADWSSERRDDPPRSDTMMLFTIDPLSKTAGMLSIPRDLWVDIPGFDYGKINTAYALGEAYKLPGGGPALAARTVEQVIGVKVDYYARVDFRAFEEFIDEIGGVRITPSEDIVLVPINAHKETLRAGETYTLPGYLALAYARNRKTEGGDVDRAQRQQEVVFAIRDRLLEPGGIARILGNAPAVYREVQSGLVTNLSLDDAVKLGMLAVQIPRESIKTGVINYEMAILTQSPDGLSILQPLPDEIRALVDQIFTTNSVGPLATGDATTLMQAEAARVEVLNGSYGEGLAGRTAEYLTAQGMNVTGNGNAGDFYTSTIVIDRTGNPYTLQYLKALFNLTGAVQIQTQFDPNAAADVTIILGQDWANSNPMGQ